MTERRKPTYRDRNGNRRTKWKRETRDLFGKKTTEYTLKYGDTRVDIWTWSDWKDGTQGTARKKKPFKYRVTRGGKTISEGWESSLSTAKAVGEREAESK